MDIQETNLRSNVVRKRRAASSQAMPTAAPVTSTEQNASEAKLEKRPALTLLTGPAGSGKTEWALERLETCWKAGRRGLLIVSSPQQAQTRAEQLAARLNLSAEELLPCIVTFRQFAARLIEAEIGENADISPAQGVIGRAFQRLAIADLFPATIRPDDFLGRMLRAPGFVPAFAERVREWKLAGLTPDLLEQSGPLLVAPLSDPTFPRKTQELARLYRAYEAFLTRNQLRDEEDCLRLAVERVASGASGLHPQTACVIVDGFYRFNAMQRRLLGALSGHVPGSGPDTLPIEVAVTLPFEACRPLLFAAPSRTLMLLRQEFACREVPLAFTSPARPHALALLSDRLFEEEKEKRREGEKETEHRIPNTEHRQPSSFLLPPSSFVELFDAPNPYVEAEMVARAFRRLYDTGQYAWSDFAIVLRAMGDYAPILAAVFERHDIPLGIDGPEPLTENPFLKTLLHLLNVVRHGWKRDDVLAFLKSSYTAPDKIEADALRRRARHAGIREGRENWLKLTEGTGNREQRTEEKKRRKEEEKIEESELSTLNSQPSTKDSTLNQCLRDLAHYDILLTRERQDPRRFAPLIEEIVGHFGLQERIAQGEPTRQQRDRTAWQTAKDVLQALARMASFSGRNTLGFDEFHDELLSAWQASSSIATAEGDRVRVAEPYDARERSLKVAAVMGLTERVFPRRVTEDPFFRDSERIALRLATGIHLEEQRGRADDERFFFYLAVTAPAERLILSYPRSADESDTLPSFYLDEVRSVFADGEEKEKRRKGEEETEHRTPNAEHRQFSSLNPQPSTLSVISRTLADVAPRPEEVISNRDRLLAACAMLFDPGVGQREGETLRQATQMMQACMREEAGRRIAQRVVESRGLPRLPRLEAEQLRRAFANHRAVFSVTELESYGRCPFQYFLRHVLRLRPEADGIAASTQGTILHAVLHRYFVERKEEEKKRRKEENSTPDTREALQQILTEMLAQENIDAGLHQRQMTRRLLSDALHEFARREERFQPQFGMQPAHFELAFGVKSRTDWEDEDERQLGTGMAELGGASAQNWLCDAASCEEPLLLNVADGGPPVAICGTLDRVDLDATGTRALVLDYKMGRPPTFGEIQRGQSLQMPLYLLAMERVFNKVGAVACYDSAQEKGRRRFHRSEHVSARQFAPVTPLEDGTSVTPLNRAQYADLLKTAEATAVRLARSLVSGNIEATPGEHCRTCPYGDVCRASQFGGHDGEILPLIPPQPIQAAS